MPKTKTKAKSAYFQTKASDILQQVNNSNHLLKSICIMPKISFSAQQHKEVPVLLVRRHTFYLLTAILGSFLWLLIGILFNLTWHLTLKNVVSDSLLLKIQTFTLLYAVGITISAMIYALSKWFYNLFLITNYRVIDLDFRTLNKTSWTDALLSKIEDTEVRNTGLIESMLDLGDIYVQTAGSKDKIEIRRVPKPMKVQNILLELAQNMKNHEHNND